MTKERAIELAQKLYRLAKRGVDAKQLFSTHPATEERVQLLREQARKMGIR